MIDRTHGPAPVRSTRIGRTNLGGGSAIAEDDALVIEVEAGVDERRLRLPFTSIDAVRVAGDELTLELHDGPTIVIASTEAEQLAGDVVARTHALPEFTRALRAFGSRRGRRVTRDHGAADQQRFFAPLIDARRRAMEAAGPADALAAFDVGVLASVLSATLANFAVERFGENGPARRALEAELTDLSVPLQTALDGLAQAAVAAAAATDDLRLWRAWAAQLRLTFEVADRVWVALDTALDTVPWRP